MNGNSVRTEIFLGDETTVSFVNQFISQIPGIEVVGPIQITHIDPPLSSGQTFAYLLTYKIV